MRKSKLQDQLFKLLRDFIAGNLSPYDPCIFVIIFWQFTVFSWKFESPQVKRILISTILTYLLVVSSPFSTHSGLECILLCHRSDGISPFGSVTSQRDNQLFIRVASRAPEWFKTWDFRKLWNYKKILKLNGDTSECPVFPPKIIFLY